MRRREPICPSAQPEQPNSAIIGVVKGSNGVVAAESLPAERLIAHGQLRRGLSQGLRARDDLADLWTYTTASVVFQPQHADERSCLFRPPAAGRGSINFAAVSGRHSGRDTPPRRTTPETAERPLIKNKKLSRQCRPVLLFSRDLNTANTQIDNPQGLKPKSTI